MMTEEYWERRDPEVAIDPITGMARIVSETLKKKWERTMMVRENKIRFL